MAFYLAFWSRRTTATVVQAATAASARTRAKARRRSGYGALLSLQRANPDDSRLIRRGIWVRRRRNGTSPQFAAMPRRQRHGASAAATAPGCRSD